MPTVITIGDRVELKKNNIITYGFIRFVGPIRGKRGTFYGIELDEAQGSNNGSFGSIRYFRCDENHGLFVKKSFIARTLIPKNNQKRPRIAIGDRVHVLSKNCDGIIRYIGTPYSFDNIYYGVELLKPFGTNNGTVHKQWCFDCDDNYGTFVQYDQFKMIKQQIDSLDTPINSPHSPYSPTFSYSPYSFTHQGNVSKFDYSQHLEAVPNTEEEGNRKLLVIGYIRNNDAQIFVPKAIVHVIYLYHATKSCDIWSEFHSSQDIVIDSVGSQITVFTKEQPTAFGKKVINPGQKMKWTIQIRKFRTSKYRVSPFIGIVESDHDELMRYKDSAFWNEIGYQYCGGNGLLCGMNSASAICQYRFNKIGDILEMIVDLKEFTIQFIINGKDYGIAFKDIKKNKSYRLALGVSSCNDSQFLLL